MQIKIPLLTILFFTLTVTPIVCNAQEARILLPDGVLNKAYNEKIVEVLRDKYRFTLQSSSLAPSYEWRIVGSAPPGLGIDPVSGTILGTPSAARAQPYLFRIEVIDRAVAGSAALKLLASLKILRHSPRGPSPILVPIDQETPPPSGGATAPVTQPPGPNRSEDDVEIPSIVPRKNFTLPIKIKNDSIRQLKVEAEHESSRTVSALTAPDLPRGEVLTSVNLTLEEGKSTIRVFNAVTRDRIRSFDIVVGPDKPAEVGLDVRHAGFVSPDEKNTSVTIQVGPKVSKIKVDAKGKDVKGEFNADTEKVEAPELKRDSDVYLVTVPLSKDSDTRITVTDETPGSKISPKSIDIKKDKALSAIGQAGEKGEKQKGKLKIDPDKNQQVYNETMVPIKVKNEDPEKIKNVYVRVLNAEKPIPQDTNQYSTEKKTEVTADVIIGAGKNEILIFDVDQPGDNFASIEINCTGEKCGTEATFKHSPTAFTRGIIGLEQAGAASASPEQKLFLEFNLSAPLFRKAGKPIDAPIWLWLNPRITSLPQQNSSSIAEFATATNFFSPFTGGKVNDIAQGFEFLGGLEIPIPLHGKRVTGPIASGFGNETKVRFGVSLVGGVGMITPFNPQKSVQVFKVNQTVRDRFPGIAPTDEFIAFVSPDRSRFFRQYYGGLRLKSYYVKTNTDDLDSIFPGILDFTIGQNESVTGGVLRGAIFRFDGIYPLPFIKGDKRGSIFVFGSAQMKLTDSQKLPPIFLQLPDATVAVPGQNVFIQELPPQDRDYYRLGVGVDLIRLLKIPR